jgi:hypothetical protein
LNLPTPISYTHLLSTLGQGETARHFYQKDLEIVERLAAQEPDRADYPVDLVKSLARIGDPVSIARANDDRDPTAEGRAPESVRPIGEEALPAMASDSDATTTTVG